MRRYAVAAMVALASAAAFPARAAGPPSGTILVTPDDDAAPSDSSRLILPGQPERDGEPVPTLPPLWLVPLPDQATRAAERARLDAVLQARFAHVALPAQRFDPDIVPLAAGQPWQAMQRGVDATLGP